MLLRFSSLLVGCSFVYRDCVFEKVSENSGRNFQGVVGFHPSILVKPNEPNMGSSFKKELYYLLETKQFVKMAQDSLRAGAEAMRDRGEDPNNHKYITELFDKLTEAIQKSVEYEVIVKIMIDREKHN